jgi:hypothetical protein
MKTPMHQTNTEQSLLPFLGLVRRLMLETLPERLAHHRPLRVVDGTICGLFSSGSAFFS